MCQLQVFIYIYRTLTIAMCQLQALVIRVSACNVYSYSLPVDPHFNSLVELG